MSKLFYIQNANSYVGNAVIWWCKNRAGYTTELDDAGLYSEEEAAEIEAIRGTDIKWPQDLVEASVSRYVDMQTLHRNSDMRDEVKP